MIRERRCTAGEREGERERAKERNYWRDGREGRGGLDMPRMGGARVRPGG